jgi:hypothetical protein
MPTPEHRTTDFYLASFLCHKGASLLGLKRLGPKRVEFRFAANAELHDLLRLYWSGNLTPVVPWELFLCHRRLKCLSIDRYEEPDAPLTLA